MTQGGALIHRQGEDFPYRAGSEILVTQLEGRGQCTNFLRGVPAMSIIRAHETLEPRKLRLSAPVPLASCHCNLRRIICWKVSLTDAQCSEEPFNSRGPPTPLQGHAPPNLCILLHRPRQGRAPTYECINRPIHADGPAKLFWESRKRGVDGSAVLPG